MTTQEQSSMLIADDLRRAYIRPFVMLFSLESSSPLLGASSDSEFMGDNDNADPDGGGHSGAGDGFGGSTGHGGADFGGDLGDNDTPGKGWGFYWPEDD